MRKHAIALGLLVAIGGCADAPEPVDVAEPMPTFEDSAYQYCMGRDDRWLMGLMDRVRETLPLEAGTELLYERMHTSAGLDGTVINYEKTGLTVLMTAPHEGAVSNLWIWGNIDPTTCEVEAMTGRFSFNQWDDAPSFEIP